MDYKFSPKEASNSREVIIVKVFDVHLALKVDYCNRVSLKNGRRAATEEARELVEVRSDVLRRAVSAHECPNTIIHRRLR